jgi:hypothetical protein
MLDLITHILKTGLMRLGRVPAGSSLCQRYERLINTQIRSSVRPGPGKIAESL